MDTKVLLGPLLVILIMGSAEIQTCLSNWYQFDLQPLSAQICISTTLFEAYIEGFTVLT